MKLLLIANPENRRCAYYRAAADFFGYELDVHSYVDWLDGKPPSPHNYDLTRIESPGENFNVERHLAALGSPSNAKQILTETEDIGRIRWLSEWHQGFTTLLNALPADASYSTPPDDILTMFDKRKTNIRLAAVTNVPATLKAPENFTELERLVRANRWSRIFLKPRFASSASGVIAITFGKNSIQAVSSMEIDNGCFYNSLNVRTYNDRTDIETLSNFVLNQGAVVERWIPKAGFDGYTFDLRVVVIHKKATHVVGRCSTSPMTNLHLGNRRADLPQLRTDLGGAYDDAMNAAQNAAACFPDSAMVSADVAINASRSKSFVLELNAFGDLLPNVLNDGLDTYQTVLARNPGFVIHGR